MNEPCQTLPQNDHDTACFISRELRSLSGPMEAVLRTALFGTEIPIGWENVRQEIKIQFPELSSPKKIQSEVHFSLK